MIRTKTGIRFLAVLLAISIWITAAPFCVPTSISFAGLPFRAAAEEAEEDDDAKKTPEARLADARAKVSALFGKKEG